MAKFKKLYTQDGNSIEISSYQCVNEIWMNIDNDKQFLNIQMSPDDARRLVDALEAELTRLQEANDLMGVR